MSIHSWFDQLAVEQMREAIATADGNEVFFVGQLAAGASAGRVTDVLVAARGNRVAVPALAPYIEGADVLVHNHPSGHLSPSDADLGIASHVGDQGKGFFIVDNDVERLYVVSEPIPDRETSPLDADVLASVVEPGGALARRHAEFDYRPGQVQMLRAVCDAFNDEATVVVEAGTGIGKSLAYLVPAIAWAAANDERVVVSTATINLQQQLVDKDLPTVQRILGTDVPVCLVKGRSNYLCQRRLRSAMAEGAGLEPAASADATTSDVPAPDVPATSGWLFEEAAAEADFEEVGGEVVAPSPEEVLALYEWSLTTDSGSRSDAAFNPSDAAWSRVCSEADACGAMRCPNRERCFILRARRQAAASRLLVVNHHLLFSDLAVRLREGGGRSAGLDAAAVLPGFRRLVVDEAHAVESSALSFLSDSLTASALYRLCARLHTRRRGRERGFLARRREWFEGAARAAADVEQTVRAVREGGRELQRLSVELLRDTAARELPLEEELPALYEVLRQLEADLASLASACAGALDRLSAEDQESEEALELRVELRRLRATGAQCARLARGGNGLDDAPGEVIRWLERAGRGGGRARLVSTPLEVAPVLRAAVFERFPTIIMTSATLTVAGSFDFWRFRVGLDEDRALLEQIESPFEYESQVLLGTPADGPPPNDPRYVDWLSRYLVRVLRISRGGALVLFTSYAMLDAVHRQVAPVMQQYGVAVWRQSDDDRHRLLSRFADEESSCLFATDSFWEGVDVPGQALRLVAICRLPFEVPTHPVARAQLGRITHRGGNAFAELSLPRAVMRVRQGFGRLIRRSGDRGVVLILDSRVAVRDYGEAFLASLPSTQSHVLAGDELLSHVATFLHGDGDENGDS